ncbi:glycosyltransferase family 4 protein [Amorphus suaedae]
MHILFLTDNFPPEVNAPASRTFEHCREWVKAGHQVTVITCAPNFPRGKVYDGYRNRLWQSDVQDGIRVIRVWSYISANEGFALRTLDYVSYMVAAVVAAPFVSKVDLVVGTSPQFFTACAAYAASRMKRVPYVFELRDLWPESIRAVGAMKDGKALRALERLELFLYRKAARVVSVTHSFKRNLVARGIDPAKIAVVTNGVDVARFRPLPKDTELVARYGLEGKFVAGYVGTHGMAHALETVLDAAKLMQNAGDDRFRFLLLGDGARKQALVERAGEMGLGNVIFIDSVSKDEVARYWSLIDVSVIHLRKTELFTTVIPSKLFECLGMGIPVLHGVAGESAEIVEREGVGLVFEPENAGALVAGLRRMADDPGYIAALKARCLAAAPTYDRSVLAMRMLDVLTEAVDDRRRVRNGESGPSDG